MVLILVTVLEYFLTWKFVYRWLRSVGIGDLAVVCVFFSVFYYPFIS